MGSKANISNQKEVTLYRVIVKKCQMNFAHGVNVEQKYSFGV